MEYRSNNNVVYSCKYHVVFCPKYRRRVLVDGVDERFREIAQQVADEMRFDIIEMEVMPDHVHMLLEVDPQLGIHKAVKRIKGRTSHDLREEFPWLKRRIPSLWTNSYFVSTVGGAPLSIVKQYIENQKKAWLGRLDGIRGQDLPQRFPARADRAHVRSCAVGLQQVP